MHEQEHVLVTVIIPVYNAEPCLKECLDSICAQTMKELQVLCINDGSTDGSLAILQEYEKKNPVIQVISQNNCGPAAARNRALQLARGKYVCFVDSDDWIDRELCSKAYQKAVTSGADVTFHYYQRFGSTEKKFSFRHLSTEDKISPEQKSDLLYHAFPWLKLYSTSFLSENAIVFPEGLYFEDVFFHWQAIILANKVAMLPEILYHYRLSSGSIIQSRGKHFMDIIPILEKTKKFLQETGNYDLYKDVFLKYKLDMFQINYQHIHRQYKPKMMNKIRDAFGADEKEYCRSGKKLNRRAKLFFRALMGSRLAAFQYYIKIALYHLERSFVGLAKPALSREGKKHE